MIVELSKDYKATLMKENRPYVVELYSPSCGICQQVKPFYEAASKDYSDKYGFYKANVDDLMEIANEHNVRSVPTFLFIKDGETKKTHHGYITKEEIVEKLTEAFS